ncbi:aldo-keto reductase family 1 member C23-like protein [Rana temporaria]|uniref:aldo-keto reductase family 1 member C23-like protein n=1 Tax=Rana temporaria TaxID=8407 RepID=UPI001AADB287|nr:aldo-keto reductase family 1 member C23-like protein [Rana temporaria]
MQPHLKKKPGDTLMKGKSVLCRVCSESHTVRMSSSVKKDDGTQDQGTKFHQDSRLLLNDGHSIPVIALGTFLPDIMREDLIGENRMTVSVLETSDILDKSLTDKVKEAVKTSLDIGYRHVDCAYIYMTEKYIGQAFQETFSEGNLKREDVFYTTKLWVTFHQPHLVRSAVERSLAALQMDYIDLLIIHHPISLKPGDNLFPSDDKSIPLFDNVDLRQTWEAMEQCKDARLVKSIGVSNFNRQQLELILNKPNLKYKPVCNQVECHPYFNQHGMLEFCKSNNIVLVAYGVLGSPTGTGASWLDPDCPNLLEDSALVSIGEKYQKSSAQVSIRYLIQRGCVAIVKSFNPERMKQNLQVFDFQLSEEDMKTIDGLNKNLRFWKYKVWENHPNYHYDQVE